MRSALISITLCVLIGGCQDKFPGEPEDSNRDNRNWKVAFTEPLQTTPTREGHKTVVANIDGSGREELSDGLIAGQAGKAMVGYVKNNAVYVAIRVANGSWQTHMVFDAIGAEENIAFGSVALSPDGKFITFSTSSQMYGRRTYLTTVSGANQVGVPLPIMLSHQSTPVFSRDSRKLAFYGRPAGQNDSWADPVKLYVVNTATRSYVKIADLDLYTLDAGSWLDISPDGSKIAFENKEPGTTSKTYWVCVANTDGSGTVRRFTGLGSYPIWNSDGTKIIYIGGSGVDLMMINGDGSGTPQNLTNTPDKLELWPQLSPDGKKLMYTTYASDPEKDPGFLYTMEIADPSNKTLVSSDAFKGFWIGEGVWPMGAPN